MKAASFVPALAAVAFGASLSWAGPSCSVRVVDEANHASEVFIVSSKTSGASSAIYTVTNGHADSGTAVVSSPSKPIEAGGGVPHPTPNEILAFYGKSADDALSSPTSKVGQLRLSVVGRSCDRFQVSLLLFWINEFFYFG